jgi:hypothetical protein
MRNALVWAQVFGLTLGCGAPALTLAKQADERWRQAVCTTPPPHRIVWVEKIRACGGHPNIWGCHVPVEKTIYLWQGIPEEHRLDVMTHEKGHSLAPYYQPRHTLAGEGLMSPYMDDASSKITAQDIDLICKEAECHCRNPE